MKNLLLSVLFLFALSAQAQSFLDSSFGRNGFVETTPYPGGFNVVIKQPDSKIIAAGSIANNAAVMRYLNDGSVDNTFATNGLFRDSVAVSGYTYVGGISAIALQVDRKIVMVGSGTGIGNENMLVIRLNANGFLDSTFGIYGKKIINFASGSNDYGNDIALQPDGKILIAGYDNGLQIGLIRLLSNGLLDPSFGDTGIVVTNTYGSPAGIAVMSDGRIVTAGYNSPFFNLVGLRFLPDGTPDTTFNHTGTSAILAGDTYNISRAMLLQPNNKMVVAGTGTFGAEGTNYVLIRFNVDGSIDRSFGDTGVVSIDFNDNDDIRALTIDESGRIIAVGTTNIDGQQQVALTRIDSNGKTDISFGINGHIITENATAVNNVTLQENNKIIIAGNNPVLARYNITPTSVPEISNVTKSILYPNPSSGELFVSNTNHVAGIIAYNALGNRIPIHFSSNQKVVISNNMSNGLYFFTISFDDRPPITQQVFISR